MHLTFVFNAITTTYALVFIIKWEQSGNGLGQRKEDDEENGHIANDQLC